MNTSELTKKSSGRGGGIGNPPQSTKNSKQGVGLILDGSKVSGKNEGNLKSSELYSHNDSLMVETQH